MAAALAFQTLFSLLPLLVLVLLVLHSVRGLEGRRSPAAHHDRRVPGAGEPGRRRTPTWSGRPSPAGPATVQEFNDARAVLRLRIDDVLESLSRVSFAGLGTAGFLLFLYGATALMRTVESSFNLLYQADTRRHGRACALYFTLLTLGPVTLVGAQILQDRLLAEPRHLHGWLDGGAVRLRRSAAGHLRRCWRSRSAPSPTPGWRGARR